MTSTRPTDVSVVDWPRERDDLVLAEKELTRAPDDLAARRRRRSKVPVDG